MLKSIRQFIKIAKLAKKDDRVMKLIEDMPKGDIEKLPNRGNGKAVFFKDMTQDELDKYNHEVKNGWGAFNKKLRDLMGV